MRITKPSKKSSTPRRSLRHAVNFAVEQLECRQLLTIAAPSNLIETASTASSITLSWTDNSNNEAGFQIQRWNGSAYIPLANTGANVTTYTDTGLAASSSYTYRVLAFAGTDISALTYLNNATTSSAAVAPPFAPYFLSAVANSSTQISLSWYDNAGVETGVNVERKTGAGAYSVIATLAPHAQSYVDTSVTAGTTYTYRVAAFNASGASPYTNESSATTPGTVVAPTAPAAPSGLSATAGSNSQITLNWTDNSNNETSFNIERQNGASWSVIGSVGPNVTTYTDTGLSASTAYTYRVNAINSTGPSGYSNTSSATTQSTTTTATNPPYAPYYLSASADSSSQVSLKWYDNAGIEDGVRVERKTGSGAYSVIATLAPHAQAYVDTSVSGSTTYTYRVASFNSAGASPYTNESSVQTPAGTVVTPTAPAAPSGLSASAGSSSQITLNWTDNSNNETSFNIERQNGVTWSVIGSVGPNVTTYTDTGLSASTPYTYRVSAINGAGPSGYSNTSSATTSAGTVTATQPPSAPIFLGAAATTLGVNLTWFDGAGTEDGVRVERQMGNGPAWTVIATLAPHIQSYTDTTAAGNTFYSYRVASYNSAGSSPYTNISSVITPAGTVVTPTAPAAPSGLNATAGSSSQITLNWTDNSSNETSFNIERQNGASWSVIGSVGPNVTTYTDTGLSASTAYTYRVNAINGAGPSGYSNASTATTSTGTVTATQPPANPIFLGAAAAGPNQVNLTWFDGAGIEDGVHVERQTANGPWIVIATLAAHAQSYSDTTVAGSTFYSYRVASFNSAGPSGYTNISSVITPAGGTGTQTVPNSPSNLTATPNSPTQITLQWNDNSLTETGFIVQKQVNGVWTTITTTAANTTTYIDTGLTPGTTYNYQVYATNAVGQSASQAGPTNATTPSATPTTPAAPTNLNVVVASSSQLSLSWTDNSNNETGFSIERLNGATWSVIATVGPNITFYGDSGLAASTSYSYRVSAVNGGLVSGYSNVASNTTSASNGTTQRTDLSTFFPIGVFLQPAYMMSTWASRGINTMVGHEKYGIDTLEQWTATANSLGLKYIREPLSNPALDISDPNLLAWLYPVDEPDLEPNINISSPPAHAEYNLLKSIDPTRPVATTYAGGTLIGLIAGWPKSYYDQLINGATDWILDAMYPVTGWNLPDRLNLMGQNMDRIKQWYPGKRGIMYIETSNQNLPWVGAAERGPTATEMRGEIWDSIIHGSTGIVYFPQEVYNPFQYDNTPPDVVAEMVTQNQRLARLGSAILAPENPAGTSLSGSGNIETCWRQYNGHTYYFALNLSPYSVTNASLATTGLAPNQTLTVDGEGRTVTLQNGNLVDSFGANECHVYVV